MHIAKYKWRVFLVSRDKGRHSFFAIKNIFLIVSL